METSDVSISQGEVDTKFIFYFEKKLLVSKNTKLSENKTDLLNSEFPETLVWNSSMLAGSMGAIPESGQPHVKLTLSP